MKLNRAEETSELVLKGQPPVRILLRRSARAQRLTLRVSKMGGQVTLTLPRSTPLIEAENFARDRADWIRKHVAGQLSVVPVSFGVKIPIEGQMRQIVPGTGRRIGFDADCLQVPAPEDTVARRVQGWLKARARDRLAASSDAYAAALNRQYSRLTLRDTKSRWGSCTTQGRLMYSWRLIMAPPEVLDYVAAHEVAHLVEMNHSPEFWAVVGEIFGDTRVARRWLRTHGSELHRYTF